ncbi:SusC/RagA family TonB-linked outer membrane protein [Ferruginibacter sp. SUN106]|uniref:SusC/RagA family TonB-linked outer membrane protein n=1 Tax=Ferruginibacter sp. SUN106 TaxID=2978348 RepID=UPI003D3694AE
MRLLFQQFLKSSTAVLLLLFVLPLCAVAQTKSVSGIVKDAKGDPVPNVTVTVKGGKTGVATAANGSFTINAAPGATLVFSAVNFETTEIKIGAANSYDVVLAEKQTVLTDVVVVGYGKSSRKNLSSAVTTIKPDDFNKGAIGDIGQLLQGKVAGVNITASGDPNRSAAVILRGASTLNSSQGPFYVIDGIPGADIAVVAPDDIATIDILKDAAATAIYGNRAANGVIIITTKKGKKGQSVVTYSGYVGTEKVSSELKMMDASQLRAFVTKNNLAFTPADDKGANTNWQKAVEKNSALSHNHNISLSGGNEHTTYNASVNYLSKEGILLNSDLTRVIARIGLEQTALNDKVKFGINVTNSNSSADDLPYRNTILLQSALYLPVSPIKNADGSYFENFVKSGYYNPVSMLNNAQMNTKYNLLIGSFNTQVKLPFGLTYDLNLSYQNSSYLYGAYLNKYFTSKYNSMYDNPDPGYSGHTLQAFGSNGQATRSSFQDRKKVLETFLTWDKKIGYHSINVVAGYSWQDNIIGDGFQITTSNFPVDNTSYNNLTLSSPSTYGSGLYFGAGGAYQHTRLISDFGRLNYNYKEKYLLQGSIRRDGSSVFGKNNQWGYFPSVGAAWRITQEDFMKNQTIFSDLKLRGSYGVTGNASGFNAYTAQFISGSLGTYYYNGVGLTSAYGPTQAANFDLQWEKTATTNFGLDFTVLKGKLSGSIDWYDKNTTGMIYGYRVDPILVPSGRITANGGTINNKGIELSLTATPVSTKDFTWNSSINLAHNKNVITKLTNPLFIGGDSVSVSYPEGGGQSGSSLQLLKEGHPLGQFFTLEYAGKNSAGVSQFVAANGSLTTTPTRADYRYEGDAQPKLVMGWSNSLKYKDFDFNVFIRGVFGNKIFNATRADLFRPTTAMSSNILVDAADESPADGNAYKYSSRFIESGNYIRFDNASLGYTIKGISKYIKSMRAYTSVNNLFTITKFKGIDPEVNQGGIAPGVDYNNFYPKTRTVLVGVNVSF